jgi:hypothetical protein
MYADLPRLFDWPLMVGASAYLSDTTAATADPDPRRADAVRGVSDTIDTCSPSLATG